MDMAICRCLDKHSAESICKWPCFSNGKCIIFGIVKHALFFECGQDETKKVKRWEYYHDGAFVPYVNVMYLYILKHDHLSRSHSFKGGFLVHYKFNYEDEDYENLMICFNILRVGNLL